MATFKFDGVEYEIPEKFTIGELRLMEQNAGQAGLSGRVNNLLNVLWIARRRIDKKARFEEFDKLDSDELDALLEEMPDPEDDASPPDQEPASA